MEYYLLKEVASYSNLRTSQIEKTSYISTENMLPNKGGITFATSIPNIYSASKYEIGDILLSNIRPYFCKIWLANKEGSCSNDVLVLKANEKVVSKFLYYVLSDKNFFNYDTVTSKGTKMPRGNKNAIMKYLVPKRNVQCQHRIASILSAYDSLIENNTKRIRLLEKMAENLYKEWFVRFRFPGYEKAEMENGLPKGWKHGSLSDICEFKRGKNITASEMIAGNVPVISAGIEPSGFHNKANVKGVSITMSSSGANAGYIAIHYSDIWAADCSFINETMTSYICYVYELLNNIRGVITNFQRGAAQPHVYPKDINRIKLIIPSERLRALADERLSVIHKQIDNLAKQNTLLARRRDLLLPRLMSGKLEVKP